VHRNITKESTTLLYVVVYFMNSLLCYYFIGMGVGYALDLVVCSALGVDMYDCVYPTRTARFGHALTSTGIVNVCKAQYINDMRPLDENCKCRLVVCGVGVVITFTFCSTCTSGITRSYLNSIVPREAVASSLITTHNVVYQLTLMKDIRDAIVRDEFPEFVRGFLKNLYHGNLDKVPKWAIDALKEVNISIDHL
jgi:queuine/archaeosine tRNA-ribosyltransferase